MSNVLLTAAIFVLAATLVGIGLMGAVVGDRRRANIERHVRNLMLVLALSGIVILGFIFIEQAPVALGSNLDEMLHRPHFGMYAGDIFISVLTIAVAGLLTWELFKLRRGISTPQQASGMLIGALVFPGIMMRGHTANPVIFALLLAYMAVLTVFAAVVVWLLWRRNHDGGLSA